MIKKTRSPRRAPDLLAALKAAEAAVKKAERAAAKERVSRLAKDARATPLPRSSQVLAEIKRAKDALKKARLMADRVSRLSKDT